MTGCRSLRCGAVLSRVRRHIDRITRRKCRKYGLIRGLIEGKSGLEIGGPSDVFLPNGIIPLYNIVKKLDNCSFADETVWASLGAGGGAYRYHPDSESGDQLIAEASDLSMILDETYEFVAASHVLEHLANPLRALNEWKRVLRMDGVLLVIVPDKNRTFDHKRSTTSFSHILEDFQNKIAENDLSHLDEILSLHDITMDAGVQSFQEFRDRSLRNVENRCLHHHVFSAGLLIRMLEYLDIKVIDVTIERPYHIIALGQNAR